MCGNKVSPQGTNEQQLVWWGVPNMPFIYAHTSQDPVASNYLVAFWKEDFEVVAEWGIGVLLLCENSHN